MGRGDDDVWGHPLRSPYTKRKRASSGRSRGRRGVGARRLRVRPGPFGARGTAQDVVCGGSFPYGTAVGGPPPETRSLPLPAVLRPGRRAATLVPDRSDGLRFELTEGVEGALADLARDGAPKGSLCSPALGGSQGAGTRVALQPLPRPHSPGGNSHGCTFTLIHSHRSRPGRPRPARRAARLPQWRHSVGQEPPGGEAGSCARTRSRTLTSIAGGPRGGWSCRRRRRRAAGGTLVPAVGLAEDNTS
jgi:hypothetical protein